MSKEKTKVDILDPSRYPDCNTSPISTGGTLTGEELVKDNVPCDSSVFVGAVVRMSGSTLVNAIASAYNTSHALGIVISKPTSTTANVQFVGLTPAVFSGLDTTKDYFLSATSAGTITTTVPTSSGHVVALIGQPYSSDRFIIMIGPRYTRS